MMKKSNEHYPLPQKQKSQEECERDIERIKAELAKAYIGACALNVSFILETDDATVTFVPKKRTRN